MSRRFRLIVDDQGRGRLVDKDTGHAIEDVVAVSVIARASHATRVIVEFVGEVEADIEAHDIERLPAPPHKPPAPAEGLVNR
jgi:hypothetical protein